MFYVLIFSILAVVLVLVGITAMTRRRTAVEGEGVRRTHNDDGRRTRKAKRSQSRHDRRKRH